MHDQLRSLPLLSVFDLCGLQSEWKARKNGTEFYGRCPLHNAKRNTTSFSFDTRGRYHCFSCGAKGRGAIDLVMAYRKVGFQEAVTWLQANFESGQQPRKTEAIPVVTTDETERLENPPYKASYEKYKVPSDWLKERGFTEETLQRYGVFQYENPKRRSAYSGKIMLSIRRFSDGELVGYLARNPAPAQEEPKYLFPKGVQKALEVFGAWNLKESGQLPLRRGFLLESPFAVMKFHQLGFPAVSCYGWSQSQAQIEILAQLARGWVFLPDSNVREEALRTLGSLLSRCWVRCPHFEADDPEELSLEQIRTLS